MRDVKSNFGTYSPMSRIGKTTRSIDIMELIKKNKKEEKKEKIFKIYTTLGFFSLIFLFGIYVFL